MYDESILLLCFRLMMKMYLLITHKLKEQVKQQTRRKGNMPKGRLVGTTMMYFILTKLDIANAKNVELCSKPNPAQTVRLV